jgi:hypothetical protein
LSWRLHLELSLFWEIATSFYFRYRRQKVLSFYHIESQAYKNWLFFMK